MQQQMLCGLLALCGAAGLVSADVIEVDGKAAIFDAGRDAPTLDGLLAVGLDVPADASSMRLSDVEGLVRAHHLLPWGGADGNYETPESTDISSYMGVSGLMHDGTLPLVAVFLTDVEPENPAPAILDFTVIGSEFASLSPEIGQTFFVGDGWTGDTQQDFFVPEGATRVFFGFADAGFFTGAPTAYVDNDGSISADVGFTAVPTPGSLALAGLSGALLLRRRRG